MASTESKKNYYLYWGIGKFEKESSEINQKSRTDLYYHINLKIIYSYSIKKKYYSIFK